MKRIGDVMREIPIRPPANPPGIVITNRETVKCPICKDAGYLRGDFPVGHPMFGDITQCTCRQTEIEQRTAERLLRLSNLDKFASHRFEDFDPSIDGLHGAYDAALEFASMPGQRWLLLTGPCGVGKTHLAVAVAIDYLERHNLSVYFAAVPDLLDDLRETFDPSSGAAYDERFEEIRNAQLLVLDDLGTENATPWAREKLYQLINHRYVEQLPTIVTSNIDLRKVDDRIMSRVMDHRLTLHIEIDADDYRRPGNTRALRRGSRRT